MVIPIKAQERAPKEKPKLATGESHNQVTPDHTVNNLRMQGEGGQFGNRKLGASIVKGFVDCLSKFLGFPPNFPLW